MKKDELYQDLRFEPRSRPTPWRLIAVCAAIGMFVLLWYSVPQTTIFWVLLPLLTILIWVASYGLRRAVATLHELIHRLEKF